MHSNEKYRDNFNYVGASVSEREKIIEDGQEDDLLTNDKMSERGIRVRCEQSDLVILMLNLAVIPDEVVHKMDLRPGWQWRFRKLMQNYREDFTAKHKVKYEFQNAELERRYAEFVESVSVEEALRTSTVLLPESDPMLCKNPASRYRAWSHFKKDVTILGFEKENDSFRVSEKKKMSYRK